MVYNCPTILIKTVGGKMKSTQLIIFLITISISIVIEAQTENTVTDFDGNVYHEITIGDQVWLQENVTSLHYSDGTEIPDVASYNDDEAMAALYGRLYTWNAAMNNSTEEKAQGVCPCGYHVASDDEWVELENYLGGAAAAGGKMKEAGTDHWTSPNTGADNSSGFNLLPGGEYDAYYSPNKYSLINEYAVLWTSTEINTAKARERYIAFNSAASSIYDWYKVMKYSVRCIKDSEATDVDDKSEELPSKIGLNQNYPNPFNPSTIISFSLPETTVVSLKVIDILGREIETLVGNEELNSGNYSFTYEANNLSSGIYFVSMQTDSYNETKKMILLR